VMTAVRPVKSNISLIDFAIRYTGNRFPRLIS